MNEKCSKQVIKLIDKYINKKEKEYQLGASKGMPTGIVLGEINVLEELKEEIKNAVKQSN